MSFAARAVYGARPFLRLFFDAIASLTRQCHELRISAVLRSESSWWRMFAARTNGLVPCQLEVFRSEVVPVPDASLTGFGATFGNRWFAGSWTEMPASIWKGQSYEKIWLPPPAELDSGIVNNINYLELIAVCVPLLILPKNLQERMFEFIAITWRLSHS